MTCAVEMKAESPCCCEGKADYFEVARKISLVNTQRFVSEMIDTSRGTTFEVDVQALEHSGPLLTVQVQAQAGNEGVNWGQFPLNPPIQFLQTGALASPGPVLTSKFARLVFISTGTGKAILSAGIRFRTEPPILVKSEGPLLPGLQAVGAGGDVDYFLLADRLYVPLGSPVTLAPVSMADRNAAQLEVVIVQPNGIPVSADIEGSNDAQTWETLRNYTGLSFGYNAPAALTGISHRYIRVKVNGAQAFFDSIVELGLTLSRQS